MINKKDLIELINTAFPDEEEKVEEMKVEEVKEDVVEEVAEKPTEEVVEEVKEETTEEVKEEKVEEDQPKEKTKLEMLIEKLRGTK